MRSRVINERLFHIVQIVRFRLPEVTTKKNDQIEKNGRQKTNKIVESFDVLGKEQ